MTKQADLSLGPVDAEIARLQVLNRLENQFAFALADMFDEPECMPCTGENSLQTKDKIKRHLLDLMSQRKQTISEANAFPGDTSGERPLYPILKSDNLRRPN